MRTTAHAARETILLRNFKDASSTTTHQAGAPFPGDEAIYSFHAVLKRSLLVKSIGTATLTCNYNFAQHNAFCDAVYDIGSGTLIGEGAFNFHTSSFTIVLTGGTGSYAATVGQVEGTPGPHHSQRLVFTPD